MNYRPFIHDVTTLHHLYVFLLFHSVFLLIS